MPPEMKIEASIGRATRRASGPEAWLEAVEQTGHGTAESSVVAGQDLVEEALMMGLRLADGIDRALFAAVTGAAATRQSGEPTHQDIAAAGPHAASQPPASIGSFCKLAR